MLPLVGIGGEVVCLFHVSIALGGALQSLFGGVLLIQPTGGENLLCRSTLLFLTIQHHCPARVLVVGTAYRQPPFVRVELPLPRRSGCSSRGSLCRICNPTHLLLGFVIRFAIKTFFQTLSSSGILFPYGIEQPRRENEEGSKNHHTHFKRFFICFVSRPCRDAGLLVVLSRHCEDSVLLYRVMQSLVPVGTNRRFYTISLSAYVLT